MKKFAKKLLVLAAVLALSAFLLTGCKPKNERALFEYAGEEVTFQEAHIYARIMQYQAEEQYGSYLGSDMWSLQVGTDSNGDKITMEQSIKNSVVEQLKQIKVLNGHADDYDVKLSKTEKNEIKENVKTLVDTDSGKKIMEETEADEEAIRKLYEESTLANKVMQAIVDKAKVSVSDEEAKTVKVYKLVFTTKKTDSKTGKEKDMTKKEKQDHMKKAESALSSLKEGESASAVASKYGVSNDSGEESFTKGKSELGDKFEEAAAKLKTNDISPILTLDDGYVIIKMINPNDTESLEESKTNLLQEKQQEAYEKVYKKWTKDADKEWDDEDSVDQDLWDEVEFTYKATTAKTTEAGNSDSSSATTEAKTTESK